MMRNTLYKIGSWLKHSFTAKNTAGNGIHSPHLFYIVSMLLPGNEEFYCFRDIERQRVRLLQDTRIIQVTDYGTGRSGMRTIKKIAKASLASKKEAQILFRLVNDLHPQNIIELGASLGITTAYLALAAGQGNVTTFEGCAATLKEAKNVWNRLKINNIKPVQGDINKTLNEWLQTAEKVDFAYIDANHTEEATWRYFDALASMAHNQTIIVIDDIHLSKEMYRAWSRIKKDERVTTTMDLYYMGIVFFDKQFLCKNYKIYV